MTGIKDPHAGSDGGPQPDEIDASSGAGTGLRRAGRCCCYCSTSPVFTVILTSKVPVRHSFDILMCGHHYQQYAPALTRLTPLVFDREGYLVATAPRT